MDYLQVHTQDRASLIRRLEYNLEQISLFPRKKKDLFLGEIARNSPNYIVFTLIFITAIRAMKVFAIGDNLGSVWVNHKAFRKEQRSNPRY